MNARGAAKGSPVIEQLVRVFLCTTHSLYHTTQVLMRSSPELLNVQREFSRSDSSEVSSSVTESIALVLNPHTSAVISLDVASN